LQIDFEDSLESQAVTLELMEQGICDGPRERRETSEQDLFRSRLDQIVDMKHALVKRRGRSIGVFWSRRLGLNDKLGQPLLPNG
jgi:hypothetical protein